MYVDDQEKALRFYADVLGFTKGRFSDGPFRWLTVASPRRAGRKPAAGLALDDNRHHLRRRCSSRAGPRSCSAQQR